MTVIDHYLALIDEAYDHKAWHGTTLRGSLRGVDPDRAAWRPGRHRHNIWEVVVHAAYWKYVVARRLTGERRGSFPLDGSNWFVRPADVSEAAWRADIRLLEQQHRALREIVAAVKPDDLLGRPRGSDQTRAYVIRGIAAHDLYHAGQIQLLKKLGQVGRVGKAEVRK
jgi:hypothetical protein